VPDMRAKKNKKP